MVAQAEPAPPGRAELLEDLFVASTNPTIAYLAGGGEVKVRLTARGTDRAEAEAAILAAGATNHPAACVLRAGRIYGARAPDFVRLVRQLAAGTTDRGTDVAAFNGLHVEGRWYRPHYLYGKYRYMSQYGRAHGKRA